MAKLMLPAPVCYAIRCPWQRQQETDSSWPHLGVGVVLTGSCCAHFWNCFLSTNSDLCLQWSWWIHTSNDLLTWRIRKRRYQSFFQFPSLKVPLLWKCLWERISDSFWFWRYKDQPEASFLLLPSSIYFPMRKKSPFDKRLFDHN